MAGAGYFWGVPIPAHEPGPDGDGRMTAGNSKRPAVESPPAFCLYASSGRATARTTRSMARRRAGCGPCCCSSRKPARIRVRAWGADSLTRGRGWHALVVLGVRGIRRLRVPDRRGLLAPPAGGRASRPLAADTRHRDALTAVDRYPTRSTPPPHPAPPARRRPRALRPTVRGLDKPCPHRYARVVSVARTGKVRRWGRDSGCWR